MNSYVLRSLVRAAALKVMFRAPLWVSIAVLVIAALLEFGGGK